MNEIVASILTRTLPITVVSRHGNSVVLSQGGQSLKIGSKYAMVSMGKEIKDPQTGESLGRIESSCCEMIVDNVGSKLTYGHLENVKVSLENIPEGGLQLREQIKTTKAESVEVEKDTTDVVIKKPKKLAKNNASSSSDNIQLSQVINDNQKW